MLRPDCLVLTSGMLSRRYRARASPTRPQRRDAVEDAANAATREKTAGRGGRGPPRRRGDAGGTSSRRSLLMLCRVRAAVAEMGWLRRGAAIAPGSRRDVKRALRSLEVVRRTQHGHRFEEDVRDLELRAPREEAPARKTTSTRIRRRRCKSERLQSFTYRRTR